MGRGRRYRFDTLAAYNAEHEHYESRYFKNELGPMAMDGWAPEVARNIPTRST